MITFKRTKSIWTNYLMEARSDTWAVRKKGDNLTKKRNFMMKVECLF